MQWSQPGRKAGVLQIDVMARDGSPSHRLTSKKISHRLLSARHQGYQNPRPEIHSTLRLATTAALLVGKMCYIASRASCMLLIGLILLDTRIKNELLHVVKDID